MTTSPGWSVMLGSLRFPGLQFPHRGPGEIELVLPRPLVAAIDARRVSELFLQVEDVVLGLQEFVPGKVPKSIHDFVDLLLRPHGWSLPYGRSITPPSTRCIEARR